MKDKYDEQIEALLAIEDEGEFKRAACEAWGSWPPLLFDYAAPHVDDYAPRYKRSDGRYCGCLTEIRNGSYVACTDELTVAIREDERIPKLIEDIEREHLPIFAEWQRRLDQELGRDGRTQGGSDADS